MYYSITCIYYNIRLYNKIKMGHGYIWGAGGVGKGVKMPEFDKIADFGPLLGGRKHP